MGLNSITLSSLQHGVDNAFLNSNSSSKWLKGKIAVVQVLQNQLHSGELVKSAHEKWYQEPHTEHKTHLCVFIKTL